MVVFKYYIVLYILFRTFHVIFAFSASISVQNINRDNNDHYIENQFGSFLLKHKKYKKWIQSLKIPDFN